MIRSCGFLRRCRTFEVLVAVAVAAGLWVSPQASGSLVTVSSVYEDTTHTGRALKVSGSGFLFLYDHRQFVMTASHVSQGKNLTIQLDSETLEVIGRACHETNDLELIETKPVDPKRVDAVYSGRQILYDLAKAKFKRLRWIDSYDFVPLMDWITDPNVDVDNVFARKQAAVLSLDIFGNSLHGNTLIQPGTSGAPLLTIIPAAPTSASGTGVAHYDVREGIWNSLAGKAVVRGLAIRRDRFFSHAGFVPFLKIVELIEKYVKSQPTSPKFTWQAREGVLFRTSDGYQETNSYSSATAGGVIVDSGNGVTMDGGDLAKLSEDDPKSFLNRVSAFPTMGNTPITSWMVAMRNPVDSQLLSYWSWFDMELYPWMTKFTFGFFNKSGSSGVKVASQLSARLGKTGDFEIQQPAYLRSDSNGLHLRMQWPGETLEFQLNKDGIPCGGSGCEPRFQPVIEVAGASGAIYLVDLREFFFLDERSTHLAELITNAKVTDEEALKIEFGRLTSEMAIARLSFRKKRQDPLAPPMTVEEGQRKFVEFK